MCNSKRCIPFRPHHALCVLFYEGKGYSTKFCQNMDCVVQALADNPTLQLTSEPDLICRSCPNSQNGHCATDVKVSSYDARVRTFLGEALCEECTPEWEFVRACVTSKIIAPELLHAVCGDCEWYSICEKKAQALKRELKRIEKEPE